jgi:two-component system, NtrC family, response regulator HydG
MTRSLRILVVDDDIDNAQSLAELFDLEGHDAMVVHSGEAAIAAHMAQHFDLAFMDVMMPGLNGVESFLCIRKMRPQAKVFMMTGYSVEELLHQAVEQGALGVLNKPMDVDAILKMVADVGSEGLMVAPAVGSNYGQKLHGLISHSGKSCHIYNGSGLPPQIETSEDVLILDLKTPLIDSVGFCSGLRRDGSHQPTIIVTPQSPKAEIGHEALRDMTVTGILNKPFDPMDLLDRLDTLAA